MKRDMQQKVTVRMLEWMLQRTQSKADAGTSIKGDNFEARSLPRGKNRGELDRVSMQREEYKKTTN